MRSLLLSLLLAASAAAAPSSATFNGETDRAGMFAAWRQAAPEALPFPVLGTYRYAIVRRSALVDVTAEVRRRLSKAYGIGVSIVTGSTGWNPRFDCEAFAMAYSLELRARLMRELWHSDEPATRPAVFIFGHLTGPEKGHALLMILTDEGPVFVDPVVGVVVLSPEQRRTAYFQTL